MQGNAKGWAVKRGTRKYEARWYSQDGTRRAKTGFSRKSDAERFARNAAQETAKVISGEIAAERPATVDALLDTFLAGYAKGIGAKSGRVPDASTVKKITAQLQHARTSFDTRNPETLKRNDIETWKLALSDGVRHDVFRALRQAFAWGVLQGLITRDPSVGIANPRRAQHERRDVTPFETWDEVEKVAAELDARYAAIPVVLVGTGLRPEELFGLHRSDVDWENRRLHVHRRFTSGVVKDGTKTGGERLVPFGQRVYDALKAIPPRLDTPILFPAPRGGYIDVEKFRHREWAPALRAAGIAHKRVYDTRHTFISWHLAKGTPIATVAAWAGTSITQIQDTYRRYLKGEDALASTLDGYGEAAVS